MLPDEDTCYRAVAGRDARFDGWFFTAVRTTGIYCRPSCPAITPHRKNVTFFASAAAAQRAGYRACKRCRPDATPGSPEWDVRGDLAARAIRLIGDGVIDRDGVPGLAHRLGYSERQLGRVLQAEVGAGPLALARAQRAQTARVLLETTDLPVTDVAFAAGFASVRQFNETVRAVFATTPSTLRERRRRNNAPAGVLALRLPYRAPMDLAATLDFLGDRAIPGVEAYDGVRLTRTIALPHRPALVAVGKGDGSYVAAELRLTDHRDLIAAVSRIRRWLDLDADPVAVDALLGADPALEPLVRKRPGLRSPGVIDGFEAAVRAVVGQQVSVAGARTVLGRISATHGEAAFDGEPWRLFPSPAALANATDLPMPTRRATTVRTVAAAVDRGDVTLDPGADRHALKGELEELPGIGPWTADYVRLRLGDPDVLLATDLGVRKASAALDITDTDRWAPWRSYATHHLWAALH